MPGIFQASDIKYEKSMHAAGYSVLIPLFPLCILATFPEKLFSAKLIQSLCFPHEAKVRRDGPINARGLKEGTKCMEKRPRSNTMVHFQTVHGKEA